MSRFMCHQNLRYKSLFTHQMKLRPKMKKSKCFRGKVSCVFWKVAESFLIRVVTNSVGNTFLWITTYICKFFKIVLGVCPQILYIFRNQFLT